MMWTMMMDNDIKGMSDILTVCNLIILCYYFYYHYLPWNNDFRSVPKAQIWQIQPPLLPGRLREGRYLTLIMGAIDRGKWGDQDALGLKFMMWFEGKIFPVYCFWCAARVVHCGIISQYTYWLLWLIVMILDCGLITIEEVILDVPHCI